MKCRLVSVAVISAMSVFLVFLPGCTNEDKAPSDSTVKKGLVECIKTAGKLPFDVKLSNFERIGGKYEPFGDCYKVEFSADFKAAGITCEIRDNTNLFLRRNNAWKPGAFFDSRDMSENDVNSMWACIHKFRAAAGIKE